MNNKKISLSSHVKKPQGYKAMLISKENDDSNSSKELSLSPSSSSHSEMNNNSYQEDTIQTMYEKEEKKINITPKEMFFRNIDMLISHLSKEESDEDIEEVDDYNNELYKEKKELQEEIRKLKVKNDELNNKINNAKMNGFTSTQSNYKDYLQKKLNEYSKENIKLKTELNSKANAKSKIQFLLKSQIKKFETVLKEIKNNEHNNEDKERPQTKQYMSSHNDNNEEKTNSKVFFDDKWLIQDFSKDEEESSNLEIEDLSTNNNHNVNNGIVTKAKKVVTKTNFVKNSKINTGLFNGGKSKSKPNFNCSSLIQKSKSNRNKNNKY